MKELFALIDEHRKEYEQGSATISGDIPFSMHRTVRQITHYILSRYMDGGADNRDPETGERRPFRNVGNAIVDLEWRAKNIDRKSIEAHATDADHIFSLIVNKEVQQWMKDNNFGKTIDDYQRKKSEYGSVLLKKTETKDKLIIEPVKWERTSVDPNDIAGGMKVEQSFFSILDLKKKADVWDEIDPEEGEFALNLAIEAAKKRRGQERRIEILDIEGEFEAHLLDHELEEGDNGYDDIRLYNLIVACVGNRKYLLYKDELNETRFKHDRRKEVEDRDFGLGVWEEVFETQIATNENVIDEREAMSIAGKVVIKTNRKNSPSGLSLRHGEVIDLEGDEFFDPVALGNGVPLPQFQNTIDAWFANMQRDQSAYPGVTGEEPKASTPGVSLELQAAQGASIFNKRRDQDGFFLLEVLMDWVIPFVVKQINKDHTLTASYSLDELQMLDEAIRDYLTDHHTKEAMLSDAMLQEGMPFGTTPEDRQVIGGAVSDQLKKQGSKRTLRIPKGYITLDRIKKKVRFDITDEMSDDQRELNALSTTLAALAPNDPARARIIAQMMEVMGLSAASYPMGTTPTEPTKPQGKNTRVNSVLPEGQQA